MGAGGPQGAGEGPAVEPGTPLLAGHGGLGCLHQVLGCPVRRLSTHGAGPWG